MATQERWQTNRPGSPRDFVKSLGWKLNSWMNVSPAGKRGKSGPLRDGDEGRKRQPVDDLAAAVLLRDYLEQQNQRAAVESGKD